MNSKDFSCSTCVHFSVCSLKEQFINAQKAVDSTIVPLRNGHTINLSDISWIKQPHLNCDHFRKEKIEEKGVNLK